MRFDEAIKSYGFEQNLDEQCVYKLIKEKSVVFMILSVDDILLIGNDKESMNDINDWLSRKFEMKDLGNASYVLGIKIIRDRKKRLLALS